MLQEQDEPEDTGSEQLELQRQVKPKDNEDNESDCPVDSQRQPLLNEFK